MCVSGEFLVLQNIIKKMAKKKTHLPVELHVEW